jgi:hypothetical protein
MNLDFFKILYLTRSWSQSRNFDIPAPAPAKIFDSMRLRLHNTVRNPANILGGHPRGKFLSELPIPLQSCWSGRQLHFLPPNQQFATQDNKIWPASAHFTGEQNTIDSMGVDKRLTSQQRFLHWQVWPVAALGKETFNAGATRLHCLHKFCQK